LILDLHNKIRNTIAGGGMAPKFLAARRMMKMDWNLELAQLAVLNTKQCSMIHDCHNTGEKLSSFDWKLS
jgi:uncharacterized protein YcsI (UPF0317 family)